MTEHRTQVAFKGNREYIVKVNLLSMAYPNQQTDIKIPHGSRDYIIVPGTVKITFRLDIESTNKARSIVGNTSIVLIRKKILILGSKETDIVNNGDI